ncbi:pleckstrin homology domain-containing family A member 7-like isoform X2 [Heterodontus francisci]|uniref:pleckstrin homology domain-containing family A member 7-like isoform X2 n=1 Tax=Heterodontus francisci TaxID=7792 RepID=UPI00355B984B
MMSEGMERPRSGLSQTSSIVTISSVNTSQGSKSVRAMKKVHTFAKRDQAVKRDPNSMTVIRGWLHKQDSSGLKLWKRRWFVLSDFCLFYYRDSREERILGSIPMPSYIISAADPQDRKTRKFTFKAEHPGMRTYYFSADTQEDMNGWIKAMSQSARVESENTSIFSAKDSKRISQEQRYSSFEDFTKSGFLQHRENAQSAESLEIAKLSEPRQQTDSRSELMEKTLEKVRRELLAPTNGQRNAPSSTISLEQLTPPQSGTVPPPTPTSGLQNTAFRFEGSSKPRAEDMDPQRRNSLSHVEQWIRSQKEKVPEGQENEHYVVKTGSGHVYECLIDSYPISSVSPQFRAEHCIPISLSTGNQQHQEHTYNHSLSGEQEEQINHQWLQEKVGEYRASSPITIYPSRILPSGTPDLLSSRSIRSLRSNSLPITSDTPRYQVLRRSHTPDDRYVILSEGQHKRQVSEPSSERVLQRSLDRSYTPIPQHSPSSLKSPVPFSGLSQRAQSPLERSETGSHEDIYYTASSQKVSRHFRPHTPVGRIDIFPSQQTSPMMGRSYLHIAAPHSLPPSITLLPTEKQPGEYYLAPTSARARGQTLNRPYSRPQTPSNRLNVLPSDENYSFLSDKSHGPFRIQPRSPPPFERMTMVPREEKDTESLSATLPSRRFGHFRAQTPVERLTVLPGKDHHKEMFISRHRTPGTQETNSGFSQLPPRPPTSPRPSPNPLLPRRLSISPSTCAQEMYREFTLEPVKMAESEVDVLLTRLCGQDRVLQGLMIEATQLKAEKDKLEGVLEVTHCQLLDFGGQLNIVEQLTLQQRILQEDLIEIRARLCDLSTEIEEAWNEYEFLENELQRLRATRELLSRCASPQERGEAQRDLWMIEDVMFGLSNNKKSFQVAIGSTRHPEHHSVLQRDSLKTPFGSSPLPSPTSRQSLPHSQTVDNVPLRPPLPDMVHRDQHSISKHSETETASPTVQSEQKHPQGQRNDGLQSDLVTNGIYKGKHTLTVGGIKAKGKMSAEEQMERMKRHQKAQLQERPRAGCLSQRSVAVSPIMGKPSKVVVTTRYIEVDPDTPLSPEQMQEKERTLEKIKTMIAKTSPSVAGSWAPADRGMHLGETERDRIINLSYALATEASERSKVMAAKALAELQKEEEGMGSPRVRGTGHSENTESQTNLDKNGLIFNLGHHKEAANPNSGYHQESANPSFGQQEGTVNQSSGQNNQGERTNQYSTKESIASNPSSTLGVEAVNLKLEEQKNSTILDFPQELEGVSSTGRALSNISLFVMEDYSDRRLSQE